MDLQQQRGSEPRLLMLRAGGPCVSTGAGFGAAAPGLGDRIFDWCRFLL